MKIESGIDIPDANPFGGKRGIGRPRLYPFDELAVGDSFAVPKKKRGSISAGSARYGKRTGRKFVTRICPKNPDHVRVWRTA